MKAYLLHRDSDAELQRGLPANEETLAQDLELDTLFAAMARGDPFLFDVARRWLLLSLDDPDAIVYRQRVLADCLENPSVVRELYALAGDAIEAERRIWGGLSTSSPRYTLHTSVEKMGVLVGFLRRLREMTDEHAGKFSSEGFKRFFAMLAEELNEPYFDQIESDLKSLQFKGGMLISAQLGAGSKGDGYTLRRPREQSLFQRVFDRSGLTFTIPERDENGFRALGDLQDRGTNLVANAVQQSVEHVLHFFVMLCVEIGFYVACVNLSERLAEKGEPICFPVAVSAGEHALSGQGLYDVSLTLTIEQRIVSNEMNADRKTLVMITGANQGGKSTFLRGIGLAQLMTQCGMFVGGESFRTTVCDGLFTHYKREEDETMESGKLDEELARMSDIADHISPNSILLCNESFAATNEREGSEIARQVLQALLSNGIRVLFVTHLFDLADCFYRQELDSALFLRAERGSDGARPFKLAEGKPLPTSYGEDSYRRIFGREPDQTVAGAPEGK